MKLPVDLYQQQLLEQWSVAQAGLAQMSSREKLKFFGVALALVFGIYRMAYLPPTQRVRNLKAQILQVEEEVKLLARYRELQENWKTQGGRFGSAERKGDTWLLDHILEVARALRLSLDSISSPRAAARKNFQVISLDLQATWSYPELIRFVGEIENSPELLMISSFSVKKNAQTPGKHGVVLSVSTLVPEGSPRS
ncbi:MAG: hypothetical protein HY402_00655 [Elusimicrobia bacterium]|nr:hypothetical protein [Elusimicrobiota bacterium]